MQIDTTKMSSRGQVVIPLDMRKDIKEGDKLIVIRRENEIIIRRSVSDLALLSEESFAETWLSDKEDKAWKDL